MGNTTRENNKAHMRKTALHIALVAAAICLFVWMDFRATAARSVPERQWPAAPLLRTDSQKDIYDIYKRYRLWGARVVHLNRFLNLVEYLPREENVSMPFPVRVKDARPLYEKGLDDHNWLFIANRTGLVRTATVVLPASVFRERLAQFQSDFAFSVSGTVITGYAQDMPLMVTTLDAMPVIPEPVIVDIDAGYFGFGEEPGEVLATLRKKCPDIRLVVASGSADEPAVTDADRDRLKAFLKGWTAS